MVHQLGGGFENLLPLGSRVAHLSLVHMVRRISDVGRFEVSLIRLMWMAVDVGVAKTSHVD